MTLRPELEALQALRVESDPAMEEALCALKGAALEPESTAELEIAVIRRWRHERSITNLRYWIPVLIGAIASGAAMLVVAQALASQPEQSAPPVLGEFSESARP